MQVLHSDSVTSDEAEQAALRRVVCDCAAVAVEVPGEGFALGVPNRLVIMCRAISTPVRQRR